MCYIYSCQLFKIVALVAFTHSTCPSVSVTQCLSSTIRISAENCYFHVFRVGWHTAYGALLFLLSVTAITVTQNGKPEIPQALKRNASAPASLQELWGNKNGKIARKILEFVSNLSFYELPSD